MFYVYKFMRKKLVLALFELCFWVSSTLPSPQKLTTSEGFPLFYFLSEEKGNI